jgi:quinol monooxygenase YgiN
VILHIVLLRPKPSAADADVEALDRALEGLRGEIPGILGYTWGPNGSPEGLGRGYALGFVMTFESAAARDAYLPHPAHAAVGPLVAAVAEVVLVYDLEVSDE